MPDDLPISADTENNTAEAPPARPAPLVEREKADMGCVALLMAAFVGVFFIPAVFLLGGAPVIIPLITLLLVAVITPVINPTERMAPKARWIGRAATFFGLSLLLGFVAVRIFTGNAPVLRE